MATSKDLKPYLTKAQVVKLKQLTDGLAVGRVLGDRVLVKLVEPYTEMDRVEKEGVLVIPETARETNTPMPTTGIVVAVGAGMDRFVDPWVKEGDMIMFSKFAGSECYFNQEHFRIMEVKEILCTLIEQSEEAVPSVVPVAG